MPPALHPSAAASPLRRWSLYAGVYFFACGAVVAVVLGDILSLLGEVIGLPAPYSLVVFASPAFGIGAATWWALVERRHARTYPVGAAVGLVTALATGLVWTVWFVRVWGVEMLAAPPVAALVLVVLGLVSIAGVVVGLPPVALRRRLTPGAA